jgi:hypothetical protein
MKPKQKIPYGQPIEVCLTERQCDLIRNTYPDLVSWGVNKVEQHHWSLDQIEEIQEGVAAEANHTGNCKLEAEFDALHLHLQSFLDTYVDQSDL